MLDAAIKAVIAYLLGSLLGGLIVGKISGGVDIRMQGSGNAGGTNALRTQGVWFAFWVMLIDIGKGWLAVHLLPTVAVPQGNHNTLPQIWVPVACATAVVIGHVYPIYFGFRGGKGAATLLGVVIGIQPLGAVIVMITWLIVLMTTGFVGLSTMLATVAFAAYQVERESDLALAWFGLAMAIFVVFTHRANIARMLAGTENRSKKLWLFRPR